MTPANSPGMSGRRVRIATGSSCSSRRIWSMARQKGTAAFSAPDRLKRCLSPFCVPKPCPMGPRLLPHAEVVAAVVGHEHRPRGGVALEQVAGHVLLVGPGVGKGDGEV